MKLFQHIVLLLAFFISAKVSAQKPLNPAIERGPKSRIELIKADSLVVNSGESEVRTFYGDVKFFHRGVYLSCRKAIHNSGSNNLVAYGKIKINQGDTLTITGDTLYYDGNTRFARIHGKRVILTDDDMTLESTKMNYNLNTDLAYYSTPGIIHQDSVQLTSKTGYYNTTSKIFNYYGDVEILHPDFTLCTDTLDYNSNTKRADFNSFTTINSPDGLLSANRGYYFTDSRKSKFYGRSLVENEEYTLEADTLDFDMTTEEGFGVGNVAFFSKKDSLYLNGDYGEKISSKGITKMTGNTLMRSISSGDTLYLRADYIYAYQNRTDAYPLVAPDSTLSDSLKNLSATTDSLKIIMPKDSLTSVDIKPILTITDSLTFSDSLGVNSPLKKPESKKEPESEVDKIQFIIAHGTVKIYRDDFQSTCDSLNYDLVDSVITFMGKPMIWSGDNQLEGDTINAYMVQNKIRSMFLNQNSFVIAQDSVKNFNQIKGRQIVALFDSLSSIKQVEVDGNGESIYYALDENNKLIGLNRVQCSKMRLSFLDRKVKRISFIGSPESKLIPPIEIKEGQNKLANFSWNINLKPTKLEVLGSNFEENSSIKTEKVEQPNSVF